MKNQDYLYLDHAASTPMRKSAMDKYIEAESYGYANSSGGHKLSRNSKNLLEDSREKIAELLQVLLSDPVNVDALVPESTGERDMLYQDPELGFCILAHKYDGEKSSPPHDHGPSWAIYAQARGETIMRDYDKIEDASADKPGKVKVSRTYSLTPGIAHVYNEGDLHSPTRIGPTSLVRVEGTDMSKIERLRFELA